ncbi:MAG: PDZ domain-containing protein [Chloroflexi bacterium]|nr:PDZ domain-containing protein [Chloroflexota bacterium]
MMRGRVRVLGAALAGVGLIAAIALLASGGLVLAQERPSQTPQPQATPGQQQAFLGVAVANITPQIKDRLGLKVDQGVVVVRVAANSPAQSAGVQQGDVLLSVGDTAVTTAEDVTRKIQGAKSGDTLALRINRAGSEQTLNVTLAARPTPQKPGAQGMRGPLAGLAPGQLAEGSLTFVDEQGNRTTLNLVGGKVTAVAANSVTIEPRGAAGQSRTFSATNDTRVLGGRASLLSLQVGDQVVVATKDDPNTAVLVARQGGAMGMLRQRMEQFRGRFPHPMPGARPGANGSTTPAPAQPGVQGA